MSVRLGLGFLCLGASSADEASSAVPALQTPTLRPLILRGARMKSLLWRQPPLLFLHNYHLTISIYQTRILKPILYNNNWYMDQEAIEKIKQDLLTEKKRLEEELSRFAHRNQKSVNTDYDTDFEDIGDKEDENAAEVARYSDNLSLENTLEKALRDVEAALVRINEGTYGICKYCKSKISDERLKARPTSSACIQCKKTLTQEV